MLVFFDISWWIWIGWLVIGDSVANFAFGEQYSLTHFLVTRVATSLRVPIIAWVAYHFLVAHSRS